MDPVLVKSSREELTQALGRIPASLYILTARYQQRKRGVLVSWVQQAAMEPPTVLVALPKGRSIIPLMHESHHFALCQITRDDKLSLKKFSSPAADDNPFEGLETIKGVTGAPIIATSMSYVECELIRHVDFEADHDLYVGRVIDGKVLRPDLEPTTLQRREGMKL